MRAIALLNPGGGALAVGRAGAVEVRAALHEVGIEADVREVPGAQMGAAARRAAEEGAELVISGGGDGTVNAVAGALCGSDTVLGVLPLGTFNHYARDLGVPQDLAAAAAALRDATPRLLDVAEVNGHRFLNNSCLGYYPQMVRERNEPRRRTRLGKLAVTLAAAVRLVGKFELSRCEIRVGERRVSHRTPFLFVSNNPAEMHLFRFGRRDRLDSGQLLVCAHHGATRRAILATLLAGVWKDVRAGDRFDQWLTAEAEVHFRRGRPVPVFLDGELLHLTPPLSYRCLPGRLRVAVPAGSPVAAAAAGEVSAAASPAPARSRPAAAPRSGPGAPRRSREAPSAGRTVRPG